MQPTQKAARLISGVSYRHFEDEMKGTAFQILNLLILIVPISSVVLCRVYFPNKFWIGMLLSVLSFPIGHFYIKKGLSYFVIILFFVLLLSILTQSEIILITAGCLMSAVLMFLRFKIRSIKVIEQGS